MNSLHEEREALNSLREKLISGKNLSQAELIELCDRFEDTIELASVSIKIIDRLRSNYSLLKKEQQTS